MAEGTIARVITDRGFGFIKPDDGGADVFFHHTGVVGGGFDSMQEGQAVSFDVGRDERSNKPRAENVRPL
jgi:cold shock protein